MSIASNNIFGKDGFFWWLGVVEDRQDPMLLGRCRVRIIGYHTDRHEELPTDELPWAIPLQGITSAALSGKGDTPLGPLEGTWVMGFFADGKDMQQPIVIGTMGGLPGQTPACIAKSNLPETLSNVQRDAAGNALRDETGLPIPQEPVDVFPGDTASNAFRTTLPPLDQYDMQNFCDVIGYTESGSLPDGIQNYTKRIEGSDYTGKYQFGPADLQKLGYLRIPMTDPNGQRTFSEMYSNPDIWTSRNGTASYDDWINNRNNVQEIAMYELMYDNYKELQRLEVITTESTTEQVAGFLGAAHLKGPAGAKQLSLGKDLTDDETGVRASTYFSLGVQSAGGEADPNLITSTLNGLPASGVDYTGELNDPKLGKPVGFSDPNSKWPDCNYVDRQDTNKLATNNDDLKSTILQTKETARIENIPTGNAAGGIWEEPTSAYEAKYPYNHVKETESGHVIELDDTPGAERIHIYHRTGTYVEIDKNGSVRQKVIGENYEIFTRSNNIYVQGGQNVTVDGANTLLVKGTMDVEISGKTTVNIANDADITCAGNLNLLAQNINLQALQDINLTAGNYLNIKTGGDLNLLVAGDEQHKVLGSFDVDAADINLNSGSANAFEAAGSGLDSLSGGIIDDGIMGGFTSVAFPTKLVNALNPVAKALPALLGGVSGKNSILNVFSKGGISNVFSATGAGNLLNTAGLTGGIGNILNVTGVAGFNKLLSSSGLGNLDTILRNAGVPLTGGITNILNATGLNGVNAILANAGMGNLESVLNKAGLNINNLAGNVLGKNSAAIINTLSKSGIIPTAALAQGQALANKFFQNGATAFSIALPKIITSVTTKNEFKDWTYFPAVAKLSQNFDLGKLTTNVAEVSMQFPLMSQAGLSKDKIASNLKSLAVNTLDPIVNKYSNAVVTDAFRPMNSYLAEVQLNNPVKTLMKTVITEVGAEAGTTLHQLLNTPTQHNLGQAANLQFKGMAPGEYYNAALWVRDNVAYDQIRLEYNTMGSNQPFITVTHNPDGNRAEDAIDKVVTCVNGQVVCNYLADMTTV